MPRGKHAKSIRKLARSATTARLSEGDHRNLVRTGMTFSVPLSELSQKTLRIVVARHNSEKTEEEVEALIKEHGWRNAREYLAWKRENYQKIRW